MNNKEYEDNGYHLSQVPSFLIPFTWSSIKQGNITQSQIIDFKLSFLLFTQKREVIKSICIIVFVFESEYEKEKEEHNDTR